MLNYLDMSSGKIFLYFKQNVNRLFLFYSYVYWLLLYFFGDELDRVNHFIFFSFVNKTVIIVIIIITSKWYIFSILHVLHLLISNNNLN